MKPTGERGVRVPMPHRTAGLREALVVTGAGRARGTAAAAAWPWPRRLGRPAYTQQALEMLGLLHSGVACQAFYLPAQPGSPMCAYTTCLGRYIKVASSVISMYAVSLCYAPHHTLLHS